MHGAHHAAWAVRLVFPAVSLRPGPIYFWPGMVTKLASPPRRPQAPAPPGAANEFHVLRGSRLLQFGHSGVAPGELLPMAIERFGRGLHQSFVRAMRRVERGLVAGVGLVQRVGQAQRGLLGRVQCRSQGRDQRLEVVSLVLQAANLGL